jgi:hypothetical protein
MNHAKLSVNGPGTHPEAANEISELMKEMLKGGLALLWRGFEYARNLETEGWDFSVNRDALYQAGLSAIDLRWLISRKYVEFALKTAAPGRPNRCPHESLPCHDKNTHFILTNAGAAFALQVLSRAPQPVSHIPSEYEKAWQATVLSGHAVAQSRLNEQKPSWHRDVKELRFGECVIKRFRWVAVNQETILMAFEEENWPARIDDPLPRKLTQDPKTRLHDTIKCLNQNHRMRLLRFTGDGTGEGIRWAHMEGAELDS